MSAIEALELSIKEYRQAIELGQTLSRLMNNLDFKKVFLEGYLKNEAVRLVHLKAASASQNPESQAEIVKRIDAIGLFKLYMDSIMNDHDQAIKGIEMDMNTLDEIIREGAL